MGDKFWNDVQKKINDELRTKRPKDVDPRIFSMNEQIGYASSVLRRHDDIFFATMNFMFNTIPRKLFELNMVNEDVYTLKMENLKLKAMSEEERRVLMKHAEQNIAADRLANEKDRLDFDRLMESLCSTKDELSRYCGQIQERFVCLDAYTEEQKKQKLEEKRKREEENAKELDETKNKGTDFHFEVTKLIQSMKPDPTLFEHVDTFLKKLEGPEETISLKKHQEKMQEQMESLKRDFQMDLVLADNKYKISLKECNDRYEKVKALCDETMSKMKDKDRQIMELKISRDLKNQQLSKANREAAKIDGMVFINENFPHVFNSLIYRDCVISVINNRLCVLEKRQMDDHIHYLTIIRDIKLEMIRKYDSGNTALISKINNEHMQHLQTTKSMYHTFVQTQILKDECARNEQWLMEVRKTFYLNEDDLKTFAAKVPKTINRRIFGEIKDDSIEARMFDVQAWAKECLRFKQLNDLLIKEKSNMIKEISELKFQLWDKDHVISGLMYRNTIMQATSDERFKSIDQHTSIIVDWLKMKLALNQPIEGTELVEEHAEQNGKVLPPNSQILDLERRLKIYSNAFEEEREKNEKLQKLCNSQLAKIEELEKEISSLKGQPTTVTQPLSKTQKKKEKAKLRNQKKQEVPEVLNSGNSENSHSPKQIIDYFREIGFLQNPETSKIPDIENESDQDYFARLHRIWAGENSSDGPNLQ